ncbi:MAG: hypothetical protein GY754_26980 [bacterium]|nr:hypothetical protein [bacterium]
MKSFSKVFLLIPILVFAAGCSGSDYGDSSNQTMNDPGFASNYRMPGTTFGFTTPTVSACTGTACTARVGLLNIDSAYYLFITANSEGLTNDLNDLQIYFQHDSSTITDGTIVKAVGEYTIKYNGTTLTPNPGSDLDITIATESVTDTGLNKDGGTFYENTYTKYTVTFGSAYPYNINTSGQNFVITADLVAGY